MVSRLFQRLTSAERGADSGPLRPNQLRLQDVAAQRQRREADQLAVRRPARPAPLETGPPPPRPVHREPVPPRPVRISAPRAALSSRNGLRQAMLLREVLDPPLSLRDEEPRRPW